MKIGFSSLVCPGWDLETLVSNASSMGFDGVELRGVRGELNLPLVPEVAGRPEAVRKLLAERGVELICLGSSVTLDSRDRREVARQKGILVEYIELAAELACPYVRMFVGEVQKRDNLRAAQSRIADALRSVAPVAARHDVTVLVGNGGDFQGSEALWFFVDAAEHPGVRCCWNQCCAMTIGERATVSLPRLGNKIGMVHLCDAQFDENGLFQQYVPLGEGHTETGRQIELLKGMGYDRYLVCEWPKLWDETLPEPDAALPQAAEYIREQINAKQDVLSAYKGDKRPTQFAARPVIKNSSA